MSLTTFQQKKPASYISRLFLFYKKMAKIFIEAGS